MCCFTGRYFDFTSSHFALGQDIIDAAKSGDAARVKYLLEADPELIKTTDGGLRATALHWASIYKRENGSLLDIRKENNRLYYYAYGKDELQPISETHFIRHAELGYFTFIKDEDGDVKEVIFKIGSTESRAKKIK